MMKCKCGGNLKWKSSYHNLPMIVVGERKLDPNREYFVEDRYVCENCGAKIVKRRALSFAPNG